MILIHPPQVRNCEPPVALAHLAGALIEAGEPVTLIDGALEGYLWLANQPAGNPEDRQAARVRRNRESILSFSGEIKSFDSYKKKIYDIKLLTQTALPVLESGIRISPADYQDPRLSPLKSSDLIYSAENPEENIFYPWFSRRLADLLQENKNSHLGISIAFLSQALIAMAICGWVKKNYPGVKIIIGGSLINSWMKGPSDMRFLQSVTHAIAWEEGEREVVEFTGRKYKGPGTPYFADLYSREKSEDYLSPRRILPYAAALGCSWKRCTFCSETWEQNPYCEKSPVAVTEQLMELSDKHSPALIHLCDSEISPELLAQLIIRPPGPGWYGFSRFLTEMTNMEYCQKLARSGCRMLCLGLESGDQEVLNKLKKGIRLDLVSTILENLIEVGILTFIYIMFGTPSENRDSAYRTRDFIQKHSNSISFLNASIFNMPIASIESKGLKSMDFYDGDLAIYKNFNHPDLWSRGEIRNFLDNDFRKINEIGNILKRTPPVFTSSHAPFLKEFSL